MADVRQFVFINWKKRANSEERKDNIVWWIFFGIVRVTVRDFWDGAWVGQTRDRTMAKEWTGVPLVAGTTSTVPSLP